MKQNSAETITNYEWCQEGPFTLVLPSRRLGLYAHAGADAALVEAGIVPAAISASSGGSNYAILKASGCQPTEIKDLLWDLHPRDIWDVRVGLGLVKGELIDRLFREVMPVTDFADAKIETRLSVFNLLSRSTHVLTKGDMVIGSRASSAVPGAFQPVNIEGNWYLDGGIEDHEAMAGVKPGERAIAHDLSPDRRQYGPHPDVVVVTASDVPSVNPITLKRGMDAYYAAKENMQRALEQPVSRQG